MAKKARRKTAMERKLSNMVEDLTAMALSRGESIGNLAHQLEAAKKNLSVCADNVTRLERVVADQDERTKYDARVLAGRNDTINRLEEEISQISTLQRFWKEQYEIADKGRGAAESAAFFLAIPTIRNWSVSRVVSIMEALSKLANIEMTDEIRSAMEKAMTSGSAVAIKNEINVAKLKTETEQAGISETRETLSKIAMDYAVSKDPIEMLRQLATIMSKPK